MYIARELLCICFLCLRKHFQEGKQNSLLFHFAKSCFKLINCQKVFSVTKCTEFFFLFVWKIRSYFNTVILVTDDLFCRGTENFERF